MKELPLNSNIIMSNYKLTLKQPVFKNKKNTGQVSIKSQQYQYYTGSIELTALTQQNAKQLAAWVTTLNGGVELFKLQLPLMENSSTIEGIPKLTGSYRMGATQLVLDGFVGELLGGDYFNINGSNRLYQLVTSGSASDTFEITPPLSEIPPNNAAITLDAYLIVRSDDDDLDIKLKKSTNILQMTIKFRENL